MSMGRLERTSAGSQIDAGLAARAIVLSVAVNTGVKGVMAGLVGGKTLWRLVALPLVAGALAGLGVASLL